MSNVSNLITPRLLHVDPAELKRRVTVSTVDVEAARDLVQQAGQIGTLTPAQLDVFTAAANSPTASVVGREIVQAFLDAQPQTSRSLFSFLSWKPEPAPWAPGAARAAVAGANDRGTDLVREFLQSVDPLLARSSLSQLLGKSTVDEALRHLEEAPAHNASAPELLKTLLKDLQPPPPLSDLLAQVGQRPLDSRFTVELMNAAALSPSPKAAFAAVGALATSKAPMSEIAAAYLQGVAAGLAEGKSDLGALHDRAVYGRYGDGVAEARNALRAFDRALDAVDPKLAGLSHTVLLMSGLHPKVDEAYAVIAKAAHGPEGENLTAFATKTLREALA